MKAYLILLASIASIVQGLARIRPDQVSANLFSSSIMAGEIDAIEGSQGAPTISSSLPVPAQKITSHSTALLTGTIPIYVIYYGDNFDLAGSQANYVSVIDGVLGKLGSGTSQLNNAGADWWSVARSFATNLGTPSYSSSINKKIVTGYGLGKALTDANLRTIIASAISGGLGTGAGIYLVITDSTVTQSSSLGAYGTQYCGYHSSYASGGSNVIYGFVGTGNANCALTSLTMSGKVYPAAQGGYLDSTVGVVLHELTEAATDPFLNNWFDFKGYENGDKCAWIYGTVWLVPGTTTNQVCNMVSNGVYLLVQTNYYQSGSQKGCPGNFYTS